MSLSPEARKIVEPLFNPPSANQTFENIRNFTQGLKTKEVTQFPKTSMLRYLPGELASRLTELIVPQDAVQSALAFLPIGKIASVAKPLLKTTAGKAISKVAGQVGSALKKEVPSIFNKAPQAPKLGVSAEKGLVINPIEKAIKKFDQTGTADIITGKKYGIAIKDEGDYISVRFGPNEMTKVGTVPYGEKNFSTKEEAFNFAKQIQEKVSPKQLTEPLAQEARKYGSAEEFVNKSGIVPEWGTKNQYYLNNPYKPQLDIMKSTKKYDMDIIKKSEKWEMEQVLKDKPSFLSDNLSKEEVSLFAKKNNLWFRSYGDKMVVAKDIDSLNKTLNALNSGNQRELGLALGYKDIGVLGEGKPRLAKSQLTSIYNQATKLGVSANPLAQEASSAFHLPDKNVYAKLSQSQLDFFKNENNIPFSATDRPHLTPVERLGNVNEISLDELRKLSPNIDSSLNKLESLSGTKVIDKSGNPKLVYSGHSNIELYGEFNPKKATAGGFFATENPKIAENYAKGKFGVKEYFEGGSEFKFVDSNGKYTRTINQVKLTPEQISKINKLKLDEEQYILSNMDNWVNNNKDYDALARRIYNTGGSSNLRNIHDYAEWSGDTIKHLADDGNGKLTGKLENSNFEDLLDDIGIKWNSFYQQKPGVFKTYLDIKNPIDTSKPFPQDLLNALKQASKGERTQVDEGMATHWTTEYPLKQWIKDIESGDEYWSTQIPKKAIPILKQYGYDGIKDVGGKGGGMKHPVWVAFDSKQIIPQDIIKPGEKKISLPKYTSDIFNQSVNNK
jgi:hypothetical protein